MDIEFLLAINIHWTEYWTEVFFIYGHISLVYIQILQPHICSYKKIRAYIRVTD